LAVASSAPEKSSFGETKVLVVDDEYRVRKVVHGLLLGLNCTKIHEARNGAEALEQIVVLAPDVVLLDWTLPDMTGPEFLRRLHSGLPAHVATAPVIMLVEQDQRACVLEAVRLVPAQTGVDDRPAGTPRIRPGEVSRCKAGARSSAASPQGCGLKPRLRLAVTIDRAFRVC
jgi:CheY-like chemotaxis protein